MTTRSQLPGSRSKSSKNDFAWTPALIDLAQARAAEQARRSFWAFRQYIDPRMIKGWWQREMARELQRFWDDMQAGKAPILAIVAPPQHGKSRMLTEFIAWINGQDPNLRSIFASFSERLGERTNRAVQRMMDTDKYRVLFPDVTLPVIGDGYRRNTSLIEYPGHIGSFRNTTVRGAVTGEGLDLGFIDDPLKGREEASSPGIRDKTWDWFTDDFFTRFSEKAGLLFVMTRWHIDDPLGRMEAMKDDFPELRIIRYAAIAETDEPNRKAGEALFPEHKSLEFLNKRKKLMTLGHFESLYQGRPTVEGGTLFPIHLFQKINTSPLPQEILRTIRYWDKAGTHGGGAYTAGVLMHLLKDGRICIGHVYRKQVGAWDRERDIKRQAETDRARYPGVTIAVEQEPGSGGKESAQRTIANLAGFTCVADRPVGDKELRAEPYAAQVQGGNVLIVEGEWTQAFLDEHEVFPNGVYKDQVDAAAGAYAMLAKKRYTDDGPIFGPKVIRG